VSEGRNFYARRSRLYCTPDRFFRACVRARRVCNDGATGGARACVHGRRVGSSTRCKTTKQDVLLLGLVFPFVFFSPLFGPGRSVSRALTKSAASLYNLHDDGTPRALRLFGRRFAAGRQNKRTLYARARWIVVYLRPIVRTSHGVIVETKCCTKCDFDPPTKIKIPLLGVHHDPLTRRRPVFYNQ